MRGRDGCDAEVKAMRAGFRPWGMRPTPAPAAAAVPGPPEDVAAVRELLEGQDEPTVVVAHSYGGIVTAQAAVDVDRGPGHPGRSARDFPRRADRVIAVAAAHHPFLS